MTRPLLLDLFCKAGGSSVGYHRAGFDVVGIDVIKQKNYPFRFIQADVMAGLPVDITRFDAIVASPPCQSYSVSSAIHPDIVYPDLLIETRRILIETSKPYIIENVPGAPMQTQIILCGLMFGLKVFRHRCFESNILLMQPHHIKHGDRRIGMDGYCCVAGHGDSGNGKVDAHHRRKSTWETAMGIDWMTKQELTQAIPPAYTEYIGQFLMKTVHHDHA